MESLRARLLCASITLGAMLHFTSLELYRDWECRWKRITTALSANFLVLVRYRSGKNFIA